MVQVSSSALVSPGEAQFTALIERTPSRCLENWRAPHTGAVNAVRESTRMREIEFTKRLKSFNHTIT